MYKSTRAAPAMPFLEIQVASTFQPLELLEAVSRWDEGAKARLG